MKNKILSFLFVLLLFQAMLSPIPLTTQAESSTYACITEYDTCFYSTPNESDALFVLPQSYYVKVLSKGSEFSYVQYLENVSTYKSLFGYCKTSALLFVDYIPLTPYLYLTYNVTYTADNVATASDLTTLTYPCVYYGESPNESSALSYVLLNGTFGYLPTPENLTFERNTDYIDYVLSLTPKEDPPLPETPTDTPTSPSLALSPAQIFLLIGMICAVLLIVCFFLVSYKGNKKKSYSGDEWSST